jgi:hypothetical protein
MGIPIFGIFPLPFSNEHHTQNVYIGIVTFKVPKDPSKSDSGRVD